MTPTRLATNGTWLPLARLNLLRNPFGELTQSERAELAIVTERELALCDVGDGEAVQLIGDCGRGKTTRMLVLRRRFANARYVYVPEGGPCPPIPMGRPLLIDEAQRLPRRARRLVFSCGLPLVLATHVDLSRSLRRNGYSVRSICIGDENRAELVASLLNRRIEASRLAPGRLPSVSLEHAQQLIDRFGSDVRSIEHFLYEQVQTQVMRDGQVRFVD